MYFSITSQTLKFYVLCGTLTHFQLHLPDFVHFGRKTIILMITLTQETLFFYHISSLPSVAAILQICSSLGLHFPDIMTSLCCAAAQSPVEEESSTPRSYLYPLF